MTPDTTTPAELDVTLAPLDALAAAGGAPTVEHVRAIAAPVVAAELRRLAGPEPLPGSHPLDDDEIAFYDGEQSVYGMLRARADELDLQP